MALGGVLIANAAFGQNYPKNGLIFGKEFRQGMDTTCIKKRYSEIPQGKTWAFYNGNKEANPKIRFVAGKNDQEGGALYSRIKEQIGIVTKANLPKKGTAVATFKVGKMEDRNTEGIEYLLFAKIFMPTLVGKTEKSKITIFDIPNPNLDLVLDKNLYVVQKVEQDSVNGKEQFRTYKADLGIKHDEWTTIAVAFDSDKKTVAYYANGKKIAFDSTTVRFNPNHGSSVHIDLAETNFGDVSLSDIAIYNRFLSESELLALTSQGCNEFAIAETPLEKPHINVNWNFAYLQLGLALLFILINVFTGRWRFRGKFCIIGGIVAVIAVYIRGMLPAMPFFGDFLGSLVKEMPVNFPTTFMAQLSYISKYELPRVLIPLILCISVSYTRDWGDLGVGKRAMNLVLPFLGVVVVFFASRFGAAVLLIAIGVMAIFAVFSAFASGKDDVVKDKRTGKAVDTTMGAGSVSGLILMVGAIIVGIIALFLISGIIVFLFNFWFIFIAVKNYIKGSLDDIND